MKKLSNFFILVFCTLFLLLSANMLKAQTIIVDGEKDAFFETLLGPDDGYLQMRSYSGNNNGFAVNDADLSAKVWAAWDNEWLYMYSEVMDDTVSATTANSYQNDGMELKIDPQATDSTQAGGSVFAPNFTILGGTGSDSLNAIPDSLNAKQWVRKIIPGGYALEFAVKWSVLTIGGETISPAVDSVFGLGINFHDNDGRTATPRQASVQWAAVMLDQVWNTPKYMGRVILLGGNKVKFDPTNNMTGVTNPVPYDGTDYFNPIVIDGQRDAFYNTLLGPDDGYLQMRSYAGNNNGYAVSDADLSAKVWAAWDNEWLYMYSEVRDDTVSATTANSYQNDGMELKIDPQATDSTQAGGSVFAPNFTILGGTGSDSLNAIPDSLKQWARRIITGSQRGYALEFKVKWSSLTIGGETISPAVDSVFGLGINFHDNDGRTATPRQASVEWAAVMLDQVWNTPKYMGRVILLEDNKVKFDPTNNMTDVTNPVPYDGSDYFNPIVVDGQRDAFYNTLLGPNDGYLQMRSYAGNNNGFAVDDADLSAKVWAAWDNEWLYMYSEVRDDTVSATTANSYQNDGMELKIDPQATDSTQAGGSVFAPNFTILGGTGSDSLNAIPDSLKQWARRIITGSQRGYALEFAVKWSSLTIGGETISPAVDSVFGLGINFHDNDGRTATPRQASVQWAAVMLDQVWNTPKYMGRVILLEDNKVKFDPTNNMTDVTNPVPYDGSDYFNPIVIDGQRDAFYNTLLGPDDGYIQMRSFTGNNNGFAVNDADLSAKVWAAWDNEWLYMYSEVRDDTVSATTANSYQNDGMELKIDPQATDSTQAGGSVFAPNFTILGGTGSDSLNAIPDSLNAKQWARRIITGAQAGYALEFKVKWSVLTIGGETISAAVDSLFGLAINFHDNDGRTATPRQASVQWASVMLDQVWNTPKYMGRVIFLDDNKIKFDPTNNMTGVTNLLPYNGDSLLVGVDDENGTLPTQFSLSQNYPNPFNPTTTIQFSLPENSNVRLVLYDILGREVKEILKGEYEPGYHKVMLDASNLASGVYFYRLEAGKFMNAKKLMIMK